MNAPPIPSCKRHRAWIERLFTSQHGPGDAGELVGQGDDSGVLVYARQKRAQPSSERRFALGKRRENSSGAVDQQLAKIAISTLGNPDETGLAACCDLPGHETEPRGEISSSRERLALAVMR